LIVMAAVSCSTSLAGDTLIDEHPESEPHREAVRATVATPDHRGSDPRPGRERYWRRGPRPEPVAHGGRRLRIAAGARCDGLRHRRDPPWMDTMNVKIGPFTFDHASYDEQGDVLYLHVGERQAARRE
jgi:hypothetical protein